MDTSHVVLDHAVLYVLSYFHAGLFFGWDSDLVVRLHGICSVTH